MLKIYDIETGELVWTGDSIDEAAFIMALPVEEIETAIMECQQCEGENHRLDIVEI